jgi:hypothetical protein
MGEDKVVKENGFATLRIRRVANGLEIYVQSKRIEEFFEKLPNMYVREVGYGPLQGLRAYYRKEGEGPELMDEHGYKRGVLWCINEGIFEHEHDVINMSFLRLVGVKDGITIVFPGVYSLREIKEIVEKIKEALKIFYREFLKEVEVEVTAVVKVGGAR